MKHDISCIGHITLDHIVTPRTDIFMPGGTAFYFANAMAALKAESFLLVTSLAQAQMDAAHAIADKGIDVETIPSPQTVCFENIYGENQNNRTQRVTNKAHQFTVNDLRHIDAGIYHLGTLLADDFAADVIPFLSKKGKVSVDAQGFLRRVDGVDVNPCTWGDKMALLPFISILKANEHEMFSLTGYTSPHKAALQLAAWGVKEVVLTLGDKGSLIYTSGQFFEIPAYPVLCVTDATGCGDTYMAGYLFMRSQGFSPDKSGRFAAAMCSLKLEHSGPFCGTAAQISSLMQ